MQDCMERSSQATESRPVLTRLQDCVTSIDHVAIAVTDLEEAVSWYSHNLGFRCIERRATQGERTSMLSAVMSAGGAYIVLIQGTSPESQVSQFITRFGPGVQHLALAVKDLDQAMDQVTAAGGKADTPFITDDGIRQVFLRRDPGSGVRIELIERRGGTFTDESVEKLFRAFETNGLY
jgi:methylmalonyl-CoA/ethylmalonyl-CoA epimerase